MYWHFAKDSQTLSVSRAVAMHKLIRLMTASTIDGGYLNFMGNEFGHPEWIDFPREGNGWGYKYARRQWSLVDNKQYLYSSLNLFDNKMIELIRSVPRFNRTTIKKVWDNEQDQLLAFTRGNMLFVFNFNPNRSFTDYGILVKAGKYTTLLNTDSQEFGGFGIADDNVEHFTTPSHLRGKHWLKLYIPSRSAIVLKRE